MDIDKEIITIAEGRAQRVVNAVRVEKPYIPDYETCPTCHFPLADTSHGWIKDYTEHSEHSGCHRKYGYCEVPCPTCSGGVEAKRSAQLINSLFGDAHIPWYAKDWTFATYPGTADQNAYDNVRNFVTICLAGRAQKRGLYLVGMQGLGKTSLAISALHSILKKGHSGVFITTIELFDLLRASIAASSRITHGDADYEDRYESSQGAKLLRLIKTVEWLVLDDLGVECGTKYVIQQLYAILEERRSKGLYTILTSNRDADDLTIYWQSDNRKEGVFQDALRIIDRLGEYCLTIPLRGGNLRKKGAQA